MTEMTWDGGSQYEIVFEVDSDAAPQQIYGVVSDLSTHLQWAGRRQYPGFRLLSLDGAGPATEGTEFASVGSIPMTRRRWENRNTVVAAEAPSVFMFRTEARVTRGGRTTGDATYEHRFEIAPRGTGSHVVYRLRQTGITNPMLRMRLPVMRTVTHRVMIPFLCRRGFTNMVRFAERRAADTDTTIRA